MKKWLRILTVLTIAMLSFKNTHAQDASKNMKPEMTEVWKEVPVVTPGENQGPPSDAIVLFDGNDLSEWKGEDGPPRWEVAGGKMTVVGGTGNITTKRNFGDIQLHIEWSAPTRIEGEGQGRGNSGIFLQNRYELQVLDSYDNETYANGQAGSIYKQHAPLVNAMKEPGAWQVYDIIYTAPRFNEDSTLFSPARITVLHNGILIQNNVVIQGVTEYIGLPSYTAHGKAPLSLQDHGNPVSYRNIWVREL